MGSRAARRDEGANGTKTVTSVIFPNIASVLVTCGACLLCAFTLWTAMSLGHQTQSWLAVMLMWTLGCGGALVASVGMLLGSVPTRLRPWLLAMAGAAIPVTAWLPSFDAVVWLAVPLGVSLYLGVVAMVENGSWLFNRLSRNRGRLHLLR